jgi:hypothetical protein
MKQNLLYALLMIAIPGIAQNVPIDFETGGNGASWTWTVFENDSNPELEIIANPDATGLNTSATVAKFTALQTGAPWAGCETQHGAGIGTFVLSEATSIIKIMVWKSIISDVGIKLVDNTSWSLGEIKVANTLVNQWEELSFDFSASEGITYDQIVIFPDFTVRSATNVIYFDNITFSAQAGLVMPDIAAPAPTLTQDAVISMFSNAYTNVPVNTWLTEWSQASLTDMQIEGNDTKRYADLDFAGIETVGANLIDASAMQYFHMDIWSPNMTTFRIKLVDFGSDGNYAGGDDSEHEMVFTGIENNTWISYHLPLADFTSLASRSHLAQLIISGLPVGAGVVYVDNVYYSTNAFSIPEPELRSYFRIFPNPAINTLEAESDSKIENISIYDLTGQKLINLQPSKNRIRIDVSRLKSGIYFLSATVNGLTSVKRFVKK